MRLKLDLCGIDTQLKITDWHFTRKTEDPKDDPSIKELIDKGNILPEYAI